MASRIEARAELTQPARLGTNAELAILTNVGDPSAGDGVIAGGLHRIDLPPHTFLLLLRLRFILTLLRLRLLHITITVVRTLLAHLLLLPLASRRRCIPAGAQDVLDLVEAPATLPGVGLHRRGPVQLRGLRCVLGQHGRDVLRRDLVAARLAEIVREDDAECLQQHVALCHAN
jgi:hypothetical protein